MKKTINKIAVLGSGIMGSSIACHFANLGFKVLLLDRLNDKLSTNDHNKGYNLQTSAVRNQLVRDGLDKTLQGKPYPIFSAKSLPLISIGNFEDDMIQISGCDWILEAIIEDVNLKKKLFAEVEKFRKKGTLISSNTSGISIGKMVDGRSEDFKAHFCGTHFFNPPRYLTLLEIIPSTFTKPEIVDFLMHFGKTHLGKNTIFCKDTPGFVGNRIGVFSLFSAFHLSSKMNLTVNQIDALTGKLIGRPKSATFRTADVIGLDTLVKVANDLSESLSEDTADQNFYLPKYVKIMLQNNWLGDKTKQGFYKKTKTEILSLNLSNFEYGSDSKAWDGILELGKIRDLRERLKALNKTPGEIGNCFRILQAQLFAYCTNCIPQIADDFYVIDEAMRTGFGWEIGPFEIWDSIGLAEGIDLMDTEGKKPANWVSQMVKDGNNAFYKTENGIPSYYNISSQTYKSIPGRENTIDLKILSETKTIWSNAAVTLIDLGDGILNLAFKTKMNAIDADVLDGINTSIAIAEKDYKGLVIANDANNFSAGANLRDILKMATDADWIGLNDFIKLFQDTAMNIRYSNIPVVVATQGLVLGGACELCLHADFVQMHAETYMGLVEVGVGLIPGGGGCKEFALLASDEYADSSSDGSILKARLNTITKAATSTSAIEAVDMGFLETGKYAITLNRNDLIADAKIAAITLSLRYIAPQKRKDIKVLGNDTLAMLNAHTHNKKSAGFITPHQAVISQKLAYVLCGGDLSAPTFVNEQYLLDLEREAIVSLCADETTQEKIAAIVSK